ncbi:MAG: CTP synthase (glutamine hydrolyzing) [Candidatus Diapherotrites archaeon]|nr:CTP synthase (glutamine hydrolyzing) [Candidatus Diapherotrites archaeon]
MPWNKKTKFIVITGGVLSGLGKGIVTASIGKLFSPRLKVMPMKCDGYLNVDPGTMNPIEHGEVFVLEDGGEVDMDFGHYERIMGISCKFPWNLTTGKIFMRLVEKERNGNFLGKTVQMIPHATDEIKEAFYSVANEEGADMLLIEIGGTVGDIENMLFLEAARQMRIELGAENVLFAHLSYVPVLEAVDEQKTKPTQQSVDLLREKGIMPDVIIGRSRHILEEKTKQKIALFCNVPVQAVFSSPNLESVYELPLIFEKEGLRGLIERKLNIRHKADLKNWQALVSKMKKPAGETTIALCGKYTKLKDSYASIAEALSHAGAHLNARVNLKWIDSESLEKGNSNIENAFSGVRGLIVPGGFGTRGTEGKIKAIGYAREKNIPFLGLCFGLQLAVVEFARDVCNLKDANSTEVDAKTKNPIIDIMPEQKNISRKGATMRLGAYSAYLKEKSRVWEIYGKQKIVSERHRHRYEVNPDYHDLLERNGMLISGTSKDGMLAEFVEVPKNRFFVATQAHPEFKSSLERPAPLFFSFVDACIDKKQTKLQVSG